MNVSAKESYQVGDYKDPVSSRHNSADAHTKSQRVWQHAQDLYSSSQTNPSMEKRERVQSLTPNQNNSLQKRTHAQD